ncbi:MAG: phosphoglycerate kinase [Candidatus Colwellbacteria bacterium]|nr:phosphoglycerate kinase [Candidatus Colwellbacteria bacterium]
MTALVRLNLDIEDEALNHSFRLERAAESLRAIRARYKKIIILSHRGRPRSKERALSLEPIAKSLGEKIGEKIRFFRQFDFDAIRSAIAQEPSYVLGMLENMRFLKGEAANDPTLAEKLASLGEIFINDDFATSHRAHASTVGIAERVKSVAGESLKREVAQLKQILHKPKHPFLLIVGGKKISDKIETIRHLLPRADAVLTGGGVANTLLKARGVTIGARSLVEKSALAFAEALLTEDKLILPSDWRMESGKILDIGDETIAAYLEHISIARMVVWAGPLGRVEDVATARGSRAVAEAIASSGAISLAGGGETTSFIARLGLVDRFTHLSTGGGAMLDFLAGKKLPALEALSL